MQMSQAEEKKTRVIGSLNYLLSPDMMIYPVLRIIHPKENWAGCISTVLNFLSLAGVMLAMYNCGSIWHSLLVDVPGDMANNMHT